MARVQLPNSFSTQRVSRLRKSIRATIPSCVRRTPARLKNGHSRAKANTITRGFKIETPREYLLYEVRKAWKQRLQSINGGYAKYITLGAAVSSPENWRKAGC